MTGEERPKWRTSSPRVLNLFFLTVVLVIGALGAWQNQVLSQARAAADLEYEFMLEQQMSRQQDPGMVARQLAEAAATARGREIDALIESGEIDRAADTVALAIAELGGIDPLPAMESRVNAALVARQRRLRQSERERERRERILEVAETLHTAGDVTGAIETLQRGLEDLADVEAIALRLADLLATRGDEALQAQDAAAAFTAYERCRGVASQVIERRDRLGLLRRAAEGHRAAEDRLVAEAFEADEAVRGERVREQVVMLVDSGRVSAAFDALWRLAEQGDPAAREEAEALVRSSLLADMVDIAGGRIRAAAGDDDVGVSVSAFQLSRRELTRAEFDLYLRGSGARAPRGWRVGVDGQLPVTQVTYEEAAACAIWLGARLPTEAEWQRAAQGIDGRIHPWGEEAATDQIACIAPAPEAGGAALMAVVLRPPGSMTRDLSPFGCLDMGGNAAELTSSRFGGEGGESGTMIVVRGGAYAFGARFATTRFRMGLDSDERHDAVGIRLARD